MSETSDLTLVYYTANVISESFSRNMQYNLLKVAPHYPLISVSQKPISFGKNITVDLPRHHLSIYRQALAGAKAATTKYIALVEDDILYSPAHFKHRPAPGVFAYNIGYWGLYTWASDIFSWKGRRNLSQLICERGLFIEAMEERFSKYPDGTNLSIWAEPGKYESQLGVTVRQTEEFFSNPPNIMFAHEAALGYENLGTRKRLGELRATEIPYWGKASEVVKLCQ